MFVNLPKTQKKSYSKIFTPHKYQEESIKFLLERPEGGLFLDPGLGKTMVILSAYHILLEQRIIKKMLVVAKRRIIYNVWRQEAEKWGLPYKFGLLHDSNSGPAGNRRKFETLTDPNIDIHLINFDGLRWLLAQKPRYRKIWQVLTCDESSKLKNWRAKRVGYLKKILPYFDRRYILSGGPTPHSMMDIFSQIYLLDMGDTLGRFIGTFRNNFFTAGGYKNKEYELRDGAEDEIYKLIRPLVIRFDDTELKLPPLVKIIRRVTMPDDARRIYEDVKKDFIAFIESHVLTVANAGVASGKMRQIAGGAVYLNNKPELYTAKIQRAKFVKLHDEKVDELESIIEELRGLPLLVAYEFDHDRQRIQDRLKCPCISGSTTDAETEILIKKWNRGELPVLLGHPASIAHGLNLQGSKAALCFFNPGWNLDDHRQFIKRVWRQGLPASAKRVLCYYIICADSIDDLILTVLDNKDANQRRLLNALRRNTKGTLNMSNNNAASQSVVNGKKKTPVKTARSARKPARKIPARRVKKKVAKHGAKKALIISMLKRKNGATLDELVTRCNKLGGHTTVNSLRVTFNAMENNDDAVITNIAKGRYKMK